MTIDDPLTFGLVTLTDELVAIVRATLEQEYRIQCDGIEMLGGEIDRNLRVVDPRGETYLVKLTPSWFPEDTVGWQEAILEHLAMQDLSVTVPESVPSANGALHVAIEFDGKRALMRVLRWIAGDVLASLEPVPPQLLRRLGRVSAEMTLALAGLEHPASEDEHHWMVVKSDEAIRSTIGTVRDPLRRREVERIMGWFDSCRDTFGRLPRAIVHQDLNDFNILVSRGATGWDITGILDFNDARVTIRVAELVVAVAYAMLRKEDPLAVASDVVSGYNAVIPLTADEISVVFPLAAARLCVNAATWTHRSVSNAEYSRARKNDTWPAISKVVSYHPALAEMRFRAVCGLDRRTVLILPGLSPALGADVDAVVLDLSPSGALFDDIELDSASIHRQLRVELAQLGPGTIMMSPAFSALLPQAARRDVGAAEPSTIQLGTGLLSAHATELFAPLAGQVIRSPSDEEPGVLRHSDVIGDDFYSLWWGVRFEVAEGARFAAGDPIGILPAFGQDSVDGLFSGFVQLVFDPSFLDTAPPRAVRVSELDEWRTLSPDPGVYLSAASMDPASEWKLDRVTRVRAERLAPSQKAYFDRPMNLVRGRGVWLYDENAMKYLDPINNVSHVGHANRRVVAAASRQMSQLNTNSRFVYPGLAEYAERLTATLPVVLDTVFFVCTGSEANDLALRIARQATGREHVMVIDSAYHGNTTAVMGVSPNRYKAPGGGGTPATTREVMTPDRYRGPFGYGDPDAGSHYADNVRDVVGRMVTEGTPPAAFIAESLIGTGGNYILPESYLRESYAAVRAAGGLCIADEVQIGFGRLGDTFWGFESHGVVPDIVTMGKPIGNGHPIAAVVTTRAIAKSFDNGVKYFNTFGGNPVSCAIGMSVLDIVEDEGLQSHAASVGQYFWERLEELKSRHPLVGDVRGHGLYLGVEIVRDRVTKEPGDLEAVQISERLKDRGVVMYPNGRFANVLKLKPPMVFTKDHADIFVSQLDRVLSMVEAEPVEYSSATTIVGHH